MSSTARGVRDETARRSVLVTGASGFIGACAVRRLLDLGHSVSLLLRPDARRWRLGGVLEHPLARVTCADLTDPAATDAALSEAFPDIVLHLATVGAYEHQSNPRQILSTNILGTQNLLESSVRSGVRLFVNAGSSSEYGYKSHPMREDERLEPNSHYAVAKAAQTHLVSLAAGRAGMSTVSFRLFSVYGPWEEPTRLLPTIIRRARSGQPLIMAAPDTARDFVYVDDVLDALLDFEKLSRAGGGVFNLGTGIQTTLREAVSAVQREVGGASEVRWGDMQARRWDSTAWCADPTRARDVLGWQPQRGFSDGVRHMARWMKEVGDDYGPDSVC